MDSRTKLYFPTKSKNENTSVASLFEARNFYKNFSIPYIVEEYTKIVATDEVVGVSENTTKAEVQNFIPLSDLYQENGLYGIIDPEGDVVIPLQDMKNFAPVGNDSDGEQLYLQNFIADALSDMINYLNKQILKNCYALGGLSDEIKNSPFYNLTVTKAYTKSTDLNKLYNANANIIASKFRSMCLSNKELNAEIAGCVDFTKRFIPFLKQHLIVSPITKSRTACFYNFKTFSSGLMFSYGNYDAGNDEQKYEKIYLDPGFHNFAKSCIRFGFRIDKNNPFILHVDLGSPALQPYYDKYGLTGVSDMFNKRYKKLYFEDLEYLKYFFIDSYNYFLYNNEEYAPNFNKLCRADVKNVTNKRREKLLPTSFSNYFKEFPDTFWMRLYVYFKCLELHMDIDQQQFENIVRVANNYVKFGKNIEGLKFVNSKFNEMSGVRYFSTLLQKNAVVDSVVSSGRSEIKF